MFATRTLKSKKNKRIRPVHEDEDIETTGNTDNETPILPPSSQRRKVNTFSTSGGKKNKKISTAHLIDSKREILPQSYAGDATYESQIDTEKDRDARAIMERNIQVNNDGSAEVTSGKMYRGQAGYKNYVAKKESQIGMNKYTGTQGPIRAQTWARSICRFDYQPDICKDYKDTGFCGYGDSCKFLHDRGDYKSGWQIEKEFAENEKKKQLKLQQGMEYVEEEDDDEQYVIHSDDEEEQFACTICRGPFRNAVVTNCGHYFCEECALNQFKKSTRCFNCRKQTNGVFKAAENYRRLEQEAKEQNSSEEQDDNDEVDRKEQDNDLDETKTSGSWSVVA